MPSLAAADLHDAIQSGSLDRVKAEIARGADVNARDAIGATPLHDAAWSGNREIAALSDRTRRHRSPRATPKAGSEPLAYACIKNDIAMVELLLAHGAEFKAADNSGETAAASGGGSRILDWPSC